MTRTRRQEAHLAMRTTFSRTSYFPRGDWKAYAANMQVRVAEKKAERRTILQTRHKLGKVRFDLLFAQVTSVVYMPDGLHMLSSVVRHIPVIGSMLEFGALYNERHFSIIPDLVCERPSTLHFP